MKLLLEAEIVAHAVFDPSVGEASLSIPERNIELQLKNLDVEMGREKPLLEALLVFESESLDTGLKEGRGLLKELLSSLSYITSSKFEYHGAKRLIDWSDGTFERQYHAYKNFPGHDLPYYILSPDLLESAGALWKASKDHPLEVAIHWFASGVKAEAPEDQFLLFWFAGELLAAHGKDTTKVNDLCEICHNPLYCEECETHPKHRPVQIQAIKQMIHGIVGEQGEETSKRLIDIRNMLAHGATRSQIEAKIGGELVDSVDDIAQITKRAIIILSRADPAITLDKKELNVLLVDGYAHISMGMHVIMSSSSIPPEFDMLNRLAMPEMDLEFSEKPDGNNENQEGES